MALILALLTEIGQRHADERCQVVGYRATSRGYASSTRADYLPSRARRRLSAALRMAATRLCVRTSFPGGRLNTSLGGGATRGERAPSRTGRRLGFSGPWSNRSVPDLSSTAMSRSVTGRRVGAKRLPRTTTTSGLTPPQDRLEPPQCVVGGHTWTGAGSCLSAGGASPGRRPDL